MATIDILPLIYGCCHSGRKRHTIPLDGLNTNFQRTEPLGDNQRVDDFDCGDSPAVNAASDPV